MLLRGKRRPSAGKPLLRHLLLTAIALLVGISVGHAIDARGPGDGSKSDTTESGRGRRNVPTVDPLRGIDGAVALQGSIGTQGYDDIDNNDISSSNQGELCMCLLLIVRDEESNLKANLPLWRDVAHCYVIGVDDRTTDGTMQAIHEALGEDTPRFVFRYTFENFSQARNTVLRSTWQNFPQASHILIADADWRPTLATVDLSELDFHHRSFHFLVWDHTGHTTRLVGWLLRSDERLRFKYRVHETLDRSAVSTEPEKLLGWEVRVVESNSSWHAAVHGHSRTAERFLFDLKLLELDYADDPTDLHTLFYLGITTYSYMETLIGKGKHDRTAELDALIADGMFYFQQAVDLYGGERRNLDYVWSSIRWLAYGYHYFMGDSQEAERWYLKCIDYDSSRVDCIVFLSRVHFDSGNLVAAWDQAKAGLIHQSTQYRPVDYFYIYECFAPIQAATVISKRIMADSIGGDSLEGLLTLGSYLVRHHRDHCKHGVLVDTPEDIDNLESWFTAAARQGGVDVAETKRRTLQIDEVSLLKVLLSKWGTGKKAVEYTKRVSVSVQETPENPEDDIVDGAFADVPGVSKVEDTPASVPTLDTPREASLDSPRETARMGGGGKVTNQESAPSLPLASGASCASIAQEARERLLDPDSREGSHSRKANRGVLALASMAQINDAKVAANTASAAAAVAGDDGTGPFRALVFGGRAGGGREGLDYEELLQVVSLLVQLPSSSRGLDVTYAHPDRPTLEAVRAVASGCPKELGTSRGVLHFVHSTFDDFLDTPISQTFDYVDLGGPLSRGGGGGHHDRSDDSGGGKTSVLSVDTLRRLGPKLAPGACVRLWAFAANPTTEAMFRVAARRTASSGGAMGASSRVAEWEHTASLLGKVLRASFDIGHERPRGGLAWDVEVTASDTFGVGTATEEGGFVPADESVKPEHERARATEEAWVRQVLAGGDRLGLPDIDEVLTEGGFELTFVLGKDVSRPENGVAGARDLSAMDLLQEGMAQWEIADFADSLAATPRLVNQVLAVWRGG